MAESRDPEWFIALYDALAPRVYAYAVTQVGRQNADDVVSDVFLVAWRRRRDVPEPPLPWLLGVARKVSAGQYRAAARQQAIAAEFGAWLSVEPADGDIADDVSERHRVLHALAALPAADRELLTLVAWHGLAPSDVAAVLGCSTATYFVRLHRARRRLDRMLAVTPGEPAGPAAGPAGGRPPAGPPGVNEPALSDNGRRGQ